MKILVAEDNTVTATLMTGILTRHGYTVVLARNGSEALSLLGSDPDIQGVITDVMMPESSGLDLLQALREHETWRNLPTIVTTVRDDPETVAQAVSLGCKEYILKPVRPGRLLERVTKVFRQKKVILMGSTEVRGQYSLSLESYRKMAKNFATQVDRTIGALRDGRISQANAPSVDFIPLMESATLLGAQRLMEALEEACPSTGSPSLDSLQCVHLLDELQLVRKALSSENS